MAGLFDTFTIAKRGLNVQQGNINTTSHNIANANTTGYSRQRAVAETTRPFGGMSRFDTTGVGQVGTGAEITSIQRIRDYFIDYQVRSESGTSGYYTQSSNTLSKVEDIFGEPSDTGIQELTNQFFNAFQEVSKSPDKSDVKTVAIKNASALADALNYTYNQLKKAQDDSQALIQTNITDVNSYLDQINELNKQIRSISSVGQTANDLMDKRDNLLDQLSYKFGIKVDRDSLDTINLSSTEYPDAALVKSNPNDTDYSRLSYVKSAVATKDTSGNFTGEVTVEYYPLGNENSPTKSFKITTDPSKAKDLADNLMQNRILIADKDGNAVGMTKTTAKDPNPAPTVGTTTSTVNGVTTVTNVTAIKNTDGSTTYTTLVKSTPPTIDTQLKGGVFQTYKYDSESGVNNVDDNHIRGEIAANQSVQQTIKGYMDSLDRLAASLAYSVNAIQTGSLDSNTSSQGLSNNLIFITNGASTTTDTGITAATIKVNDALVKDPTLLNCNTTSTSGEGDGKRANAIANLNSIKMNLSNVKSTEDLTKMTRKKFLEEIGIDDTSGTGTGFSDSSCLNLNAGTNGSTVDSYYKTIINNIATTTQEASKQVDNQETVLSNLENQKASVSGVSLDEEMTNLIQFQHAYQANAKMISTINELLDVVINGLKK
ncbi:flagellar hook-associated protein FlgK [Clostridium beijerinckii]|uniref:Flagellar hook-associated protein 1 n=1 Tax=Clostridium beijerinckii TaxID=1520 RepID=A0A1S8S683_CLOBE|nr:flagellar hook-associated protein FlgK [Clostridium beijerinckii]NRY60078.1 flagellar hook-associated protein 1 FlgK [Clostridium beijerinckii]OOM60934.1 flagellar hook-associated protein 1 [Clostridium beijerinckii]